MQKVFAATTAVCLIASATQAQQKPDRIDFTLTANPAFLACLSRDGVSEPKARVDVRRGKLNDVLRIHVSGLKANLAFDLFTVQRSSLDANGKPADGFPGTFGLAWYQTDLQADDDGEADATIRTILLDQIFGFDGDKRPDGSTILPPTNTFHVGFWFNNPMDAAPCGFDVTKPTPFNGEHKAGPLAMISLPDATTGLGPLCTSPTGASPDDPTMLACNP
ncbi:MAG: hypothetical protein JO227_21005 [Acetobacteraceae bacterium]|nr:hypothetical protein [Acetobacteraceae bacterium]